MKLLGILRASTLCLLVSAFHGHTVSCDILKSTKKPKKDSNAKVSDLVFKNSTWDDSMLASTVLFLEEFCKKVDGGKFDAHIPDANTMKLPKASYAVSLYLDSLTDSLLPRYGPGSVSERNEIPKDLYKGKLEPKKFGDYAKWLKENIPNIDNALFNMYREGVKLSKEQLDTNTEVGPLKYGFVHKGCCWSLSLGVGPYVDVTFSKALENLKRHL